MADDPNELVRVWWPRDEWEATAICSTARAASSGGKLATEDSVVAGDSCLSLRVIKSGVLKRVLGPAGFVKGKHTFSRQVNGQVHLFELQNSKYGDKYFVNLAFHYAFLPPTSAVNDEGDPPLSDWHVTECLLNARPGWLAGVPEEVDGCHLSWADYEYASRVKVEHCVDLQARESIAILDRFAEQWRDPTVLLDLLPPEMIEEDYALRLDRSKDKMEKPLDRALAGWHWESFNLSYALSVIAERVGRAELAARHLAFADARARGYPWVEILRRWAQRHTTKGPGGQ